MVISAHGTVPVRDRVWRLYCRGCGWQLTENTAAAPTCPECRSPLYIETKREDGSWSRECASHPSGPPPGVLRNLRERTR